MFSLFRKKSSKLKDKEVKKSATTSDATLSSSSSTTNKKKDTKLRKSTNDSLKSKSSQSSLHKSSPGTSKAGSESANQGRSVSRRDSKRKTRSRESKHKNEILLEVDESTEEPSDEGWPYAVLDTQGIIGAQQDDIKGVAELLEISVPFARTLLMHFQWDLWRLSEVFFEKGREQVYKSAGLSLETGESDAGPDHRPFECPICMDEVDHLDSTAMACGHRFCNPCWQNYISMQVREGQSKHIHCMGKESDGRPCMIVFDENAIPLFLDDDLYQKYSTKMVESYVEDNRRVKWCPSVPHCGKAIMVLPNQSKHLEVVCSCGKGFCFACGHDSHSPMSCNMFVRWRKKCEDDSETANWIAANTKECPKCGCLVNKNGGCHHVTCTNCSGSFCWLCGASVGVAHTWEKIDGHTCGRYKQEQEKKANAAQDSLKRYLFYWERFSAHEASRALQDKTLYSVKQKVLSLIRAEESEFYVRWLEHAAEKLSDCRRILSYSYAFCYYAFGEPDFLAKLPPKQVKINQTLFEDYQQQLELHVERLAQLLEVNSQEFDISSCKAIIAMTVNVDRRCKGLYDIIENQILSHLNVLISSYACTTRGSSTLLVEPKINFLKDHEVQHARDQALAQKEKRISSVQLRVSGKDYLTSTSTSPSQANYFPPPSPRQYQLPRQLSRSDLRSQRSDSIGTSASHEEDEEQNIAQLMELGFSREEVVTALIAANNNSDHAAILLLEGRSRNLNAGNAYHDSEPFPNPFQAMCFATENKMKSALLLHHRQGGGTERYGAVSKPFVDFQLPTPLSRV